MPTRALLLLTLCAAAFADGRKAFLPSEKYCDPSALLQLDDGEMALLGEKDEKGNLTLVPERTKLKCTPDGRLVTRHPSRDGEKPVAKAPVAVFPEVPKTLQQKEAAPPQAQIAKAETAPPPVEPRPLVEKGQAPARPRTASLEAPKPEPEPAFVPKPRPQPEPARKPKRRAEPQPTKRAAEPPPLLTEAAPVAPVPETRVYALRRVTPVVGASRFVDSAREAEIEPVPSRMSDFFPRRLPRQLATFSPYPPVGVRDISEARPAPESRPRPVDALGSIEMTVGAPETLVRVPRPMDKAARAEASARPAVPVVVVPRAAPEGPDVAVILSGNRFFPARIRLRESERSRLLFTNLNHRPGALIIEKLNVQRWIANEDQSERARKSARMEIEREIARTKVTEVSFIPPRGVYTFHDAVSGASGEITVE